MKSAMSCRATFSFVAEVMSEIFEKWKELSLRLDKEAEELIMGWEIVKESK